MEEVKPTEPKFVDHKIKSTVQSILKEDFTAIIGKHCNSCSYKKICEAH